MILLAAVLAFHLVRLHGPDKQEIDINPHEVASLREPSSVSEGHFPKGYTVCDRDDQRAIQSGS